jgi:hypothetical protein
MSMSARAHLLAHTTTTRDWHVNILGAHWRVDAAHKEFNMRRTAGVHEWFEVLHVHGNLRSELVDGHTPRPHPLLILMIKHVWQTRIIVRHVHAQRYGDTFASTNRQW